MDTMILLMPAAAAGNGKGRRDVMGIRLYFRNKYNPKDEFCLGKLLYYADYYSRLSCIDFLVSVNALVDYEWVEGMPEVKEMTKVFISECQICAYQDYGDLFELCTEDLFQFIYLYRKDQKEFWGPDHIVQYDTDLEDEIKYIQTHAVCANMWEFRLGA